MGTHISRVKSVDLDTWNDEQLQSVLMWGNNRANKYWEAKLAPGHVPSEAKMENFIRTKYESKRWVMDGPVPNPATLDAEGDDDIPLNLVKEKQDIQRSQRTAASPASAAGPSAVRREPQADLLANDASLQRPSTGPPMARPTNAPPPPPQSKSTKPADSLLGLDFFAPPAQPAHSRSASAAPVSGVAGQSRPDLKQSILSLYAAPRPQPQPQPSQHGSQGSISNTPPVASPAPQSASSFGDLNDAFGGLNFSNTASPQPQPQPPPPQPQKPSNAFADLGSPQSHRSPSVSSPRTSFGGGFFDAKPAPRPAGPTQHTSNASTSSAFGAFSSATPVPKSPPAKSSGMNDLFDFSSPPAVTSPPPKPVEPVTAAPPSVFNLTTSQPPPKAQPAPAATTNWGNNIDALGTNDVWGSVAPTQAPAPAPATAVNDFGWGSMATSGMSAEDTAPKVSADEEFGGWSSAAPPAPSTSASEAAPRPAAAVLGAASEDLFSNVWE